MIGFHILLIMQCRSVQVSKCAAQLVFLPSAVEPLLGDFPFVGFLDAHVLRSHNECGRFVVTPKNVALHKIRSRRRAMRWIMGARVWSVKGDMFGVFVFIPNI